MRTPGAGFCKSHVHMSMQVFSACQREPRAHSPVRSVPDRHSPQSSRGHQEAPLAAPSVRKHHCHTIHGRTHCVLRFHTNFGVVSTANRVDTGRRPVLSFANITAHRR